MALSTEREFDEYFKSQRRRFNNGLAWTVFIVCDAIAVLFCTLVGFFLVNAYDLRIIEFRSFVQYWPYLAVFVLAFVTNGLYPGISMAPAEELKRFVSASFIGHVVVVFTNYFIRGGWDATAIAFLISWIASIPVLTGWRVITRALLSRTKHWGVPAIIFGAGKTGKLIVDRLIKYRWTGYVPVAIVDDDPSLAGHYNGVPIITGLKRGYEIARKYGLRTAIVAMPGVARARLTEIIEDVAGTFQRYILIPDFFGFASIWTSVHEFEGILGLSATQHLLKKRNRALKRVAELLVVIFLLLIASPFLLILVLLIAIDSRGPIFYSQKRLGRQGKIFKAWKFRSMIADADQELLKILTESPELKREWNQNHKLKNDPRVTRLGKFLRKTSMDELPQMWNVIRGEMSLIGPRPIVEAEIPKYGAAYSILSTVRPGITGLWQVSGRSELQYQERVALDLYYIQSWSIWLDLFIFFKTIWIVLWGKGAY